MNQGYQDEKSARSYVEFLSSKNGQLQQKYLARAILPLLPKNPDAAVLDAACGQGWLLALLSPKYANLWGFDASLFLLGLAKKTAPGSILKIADITEKKTFPEKTFDCIILNMAAPDFRDINAAFSNLGAMLKTRGRLIMTLPNPGLTYPVAVWKRGILGLILGRKPELKFTQKKTATGEKFYREFGKNKISSFYYSLDDYRKAATEVNLKEKKLVEIRSETDSRNFDLTYQLFRYPLLLALVFEKTA